eukprot:1341542-Pleurochrysis_carterae.AAC.1
MEFPVELYEVKAFHSHQPTYVQVRTNVDEGGGGCTRRRRARGMNASERAAPRLTQPFCKAIRCKVSYLWSASIFEALLSSAHH